MAYICEFMQAENLEPDRRCEPVKIKMEGYIYMLKKKNYTHRITDRYHHGRAVICEAALLHHRTRRSD